MQNDVHLCYVSKEERKKKSNVHYHIHIYLSQRSRISFTYSRTFVSLQFVESHLLRKNLFGPLIKHIRNDIPYTDSKRQKNVYAIFRYSLSLSLFSPLSPLFNFLARFLSFSKLFRRFSLNSKGRIV